MSSFRTRQVAQKVIVFCIAIVVIEAVPLEETLQCGSNNSTEQAGRCKSPLLFRSIDYKILSREQSEGVGARVRRSIGGERLRNFDPFLMLDEFSVSAPAGFPDHPHRGFETVTYMLDGEMTHEDFCGRKGTISKGDLQWMTAGRGILHSEMPGKGLAHGLQLWVNLGKKDKMCEPQYQELLASDVPKVEKDGIKAAVIAGEALGITSPVHTRTPSYYSHFFMQPGKVLQHPIPNGWNAFIYTLAGDIRIAGELVGPHHTITLTQGGDGVEIVSETESSFVCIAGLPIGESIVQHGPFVMNSEEEIRQTFDDYRRGKNGFERAPGWRSSGRH